MEFRGGGRVGRYPDGRGYITVNGQHIDVDNLPYYPQTNSYEPPGGSSGGSSGGSPTPSTPTGPTGSTTPQATAGFGWGDTTLMAGAALALLAVYMVQS